MTAYFEEAFFGCDIVIGRNFTTLPPDGSLINTITIINIKLMLAKFENKYCYVGALESSKP